jgi:cellulose synthase (UDP-forming)
MTQSQQWREFESGEGFGWRALRFTILVGGMVFLCFTAVLYLTWPQQLLLALVSLFVAFWMDGSSNSYLVTLTLMLLSVYSTFRYAFWRVSSAIQFFRDPGSDWTALDAFFIGMLLLAECYAFAVLLLGYLQMLWPLRRTPVPLPDEIEEWPAVDLLIPTYNEPLSVVRFTALAAMNIDWPAEKLNVYILDDGKRDEFRTFAEEAGIGYMTRDDNRHAKAGNINNALDRLDSPFVAIFDSDHVPTRSFLQVAMGWFLRDRKLGMLQTPHHFYSPDPFERNLDQFRVIPNEGELFYGIVQDGNDFWNATFFCGSCAVIRRAALNEVGGVAVETVTEDAHTSLRLQMAGWNTAYINIPQAAGLATERLSGHVKQRIRWARGMVQILRIENPLLAPGLRPAQRLCYFNAMSHFLYALPRLIFLTAPLIYLVFSHTNIPGYWAAILVYAIPHLVLSNLTNSRIQGQHRHSFWNEIYETVLAPYIFLPTLLALLSPKLGSFNVTAKGGVVNREFFDARIARPFLLLLGVNVFGLLCAIPRFTRFPSFAAPWPLSAVVNWPASIFDGTHPGTIWMNVVWTTFNVVILGVATAVAWESQQRRQTVRVAMAVPSEVVLADGSMVHGVTSDFSSGGVQAKMEAPLKAEVGDSIRFVFPVLDGKATLPATIVGIGLGIAGEGTTLRAQFDPLNLQEEEALTMILYSRADTWLGWGEAREKDRPMRSMARILKLSWHGLSHTVRGLWADPKRAPKGRLATNVAPLILLALLAGVARNAFGAQGTRAAAAGRAPSAAALAPVSSTSAGTAAGRPGGPGTFDNVFTLGDVGVPDTIVLRGVDASHSVYFSVPGNQLVKTATMKLKYHFSPGLIPAISHLKVSLNGTLFAVLAVAASSNSSGQPGDLTPEGKVAAKNTLSVTRSGEQNAMLEATLNLPPDLLVRSNQLTFEFIGHYTMQCEDPSHSTLWSHVDANSTIELAGSLLPLANDLNLLPLPFYDAAVNLHPVVQMVFLGQPSAKAIEAAGIVASWFGILTDYRPARFPVSIGAIPPGDAIVFGENTAEIPASLKAASVSGPTLAMLPNPGDPYSKVLLVTGDDGDQLVKSAMALTLQRNLLQGGKMRAPELKLPDPRKPDDAPRWLSTVRDQAATIGQIAGTGDLQGDGSVPVGVYMRVPPDLYYNPTLKNLAYHLSYRYNGVPLAEESTLQVYMNGAYVSSTPMRHTDQASTVLDTVVPIPVVDMRPFSNSMMLKFVFQIAKTGKCEDTAPMNLEGAVLKDSALNIVEIPHWQVLPNLELFANAGYPFTRKADLGETAVVLPNAPSTGELEIFLALMGHFGGQTGYPVLNVSVTNAAGMTGAGGKDYLVLGTVGDQPALKTLNDALPVGVDGSGLHIRDTAGFFDRAANSWWRVPSSDQVHSGQLETAGGLPDALVEGLEWPRGSRRSVVAIVLRDPSGAGNFLSSFLKTSQSSDMAQSVSVLHGDRFSSYRIGNDAYRVGEISLMSRAIMFAQQYPGLIVIMAVIVCLLIAAIIRAMLRHRARLRLLGDE